MKHLEKPLAVATAMVCAGFITQSPVTTALELEEIVVTAQRREQKALDVPISLDVLSEQKLEGLSDIRDLYQVSPSIVYVDGVASSTQALNIRGVGGGAHVSAFENSVSVVVDQVAAGYGGAAIVDFFDIERIEVLNGPQGTLFGKNVSAGVLNIVTKNPTDEFEGAVTLGYEGEYEEIRTEGYVSGPLSDKLKGRLAFYYVDQDKGLYENIVTGQENNKKERWGVRGKTAYQTENFEFNMSLSYDEQDNDCCHRAITVVDPEAAGALTNIFLVPSIVAAGLVPSDDNTKTITDSTAYETTETFHGVWELAWQLGGGHTLKSITGYRTWDQAEWNDVDTYPGDFVKGGLTHDMKQFTQEIQLISPGDNDLQYLLGLYYFDMDLDEQTILEGCTSICHLLVGAPDPLFLQTTWTSDVKVENIAAFGHVTYKFTEQWTGFVGARILREKIDVAATRTGNFFIVPGWAGDGPLTEVDNADTDWMGTIGLQYYPNEDTMFYGSYSRGYKGSGVNNSINGGIFVGDTSKSILKPETVDNFELGVKLAALDNRMTFSATAFYSEFDDFQASAFDGSSGFILRNAGVLESTGLELAIDANPWEGGSISFNLAYVDAEFKEFVGAACSKKAIGQGTCNDAAGGADLSGRAVNNSPKWRYAITGQHEFTIGSMGASLRLDYMWRDSTILDGDLDPNTYQGSYGLLNGRFALRPTKNVEVAIWGRNLTDEDYSIAIFDVPLWTGAYAHYAGKSRQVGAELTVRF